MNENNKMTANQIKENLMIFDKEIICGCLASVFYQLNEHGIKFLGYDDCPEYIEYCDGEFRHRIKGLGIPLEERAELDFSGFKTEEN